MHSKGYRYVFDWIRRESAIKEAQNLSFARLRIPRVGSVTTPLSQWLSRIRGIQTCWSLRGGGEERGTRDNPLLLLRFLPRSGKKPRSSFRSSILVFPIPPFRIPPQSVRHALSNYPRDIKGARYLFQLTLGYIFAQPKRWYYVIFFFSFASRFEKRVKKDVYRNIGWRRMESINFQIQPGIFHFCVLNRKNRDRREREISRRMRFIHGSAFV